MSDEKKDEKKATAKPDIDSSDVQKSGANDGKKS